MDGREGCASEERGRGHHAKGSGDTERDRGGGETWAAFFGWVTITNMMIITIYYHYTARKGDLGSLFGASARQDPLRNQGVTLGR